jgi:hypothetical protein
VLSHEAVACMVAVDVGGFHDNGLLSARQK